MQQRKYNGSVGGWVREEENVGEKEKKEEKEGGKCYCTSMQLQAKAQL